MSIYLLSRSSLEPRSSIVVGLGSIVTIVCISYSQPIQWDVPKSFVAAHINIYPHWFFTERHARNDHVMRQKGIWGLFLEAPGNYRAR